MLSLIIEPSELRENLNLEGLLIVDLSKREVFEKIHIPGAIHVEPREIISGTPPLPVSSLNSLDSKLYLPASAIVLTDILLYTMMKAAAGLAGSYGHWTFFPMGKLPT